MGLSKDCMGDNAIDSGLVIRKTRGTDKVVALGGNPNVGKSTVFNQLTGLRQHTGNWPGKTVAGAQGRYTYNETGYVLVDLPGCYSLVAHSAEEEVARNFICFGGADATVIICDATCLERGLNLVLQTLEITPNVVVCVNLMDEADKKKIRIDLKALSEKLGVPFVGTAARNKKGLGALMAAVEQAAKNKRRPSFRIRYPDYIESAVSAAEPCIKSLCGGADNRWLALMLLHGGQGIHDFIEQNLGGAFLLDESLAAALAKANDILERHGTAKNQVKDDIVSSIVHTAEALCNDAVAFENKSYKDYASKADNILTGKWTAFPVMILALLGVFWLTITGANYPSRLISGFLFCIEGRLLIFFNWIGAPKLLCELLVLGVYRVLAWVVSVMLPPMAIFFPLFTLLEDIGFLPRVAFNLDKCFKKCCACGKQALTMCIVSIILLYAPRDRNCVTINMYCLNHTAHKQSPCLHF